METTTKAGQDSAVIRHYADKLIQSVESLFICNELPFTSSFLNDLIFFALNPDYSKDLEMDSIKQFCVNATSLIASLTKVFCCLGDYQSTKDKSHE